MFRLRVVTAVLGVLFSAALQAQQPGPKRFLHAPWVSCWSDTAGQHWVGAQRVRTPIVATQDGRLRAYAAIEARADRGPGSCENTVRLFVATTNLLTRVRPTRRPAAFREVFRQAPPGGAGAAATSLGPIAWSPNHRWLLVEFGDWYYDSDAGGTAVLLYDRRSNKAFLPDLNSLATAAQNRPCFVHLVSIVGFTARSRVRLQLADAYEVGEGRTGKPLLRRDGIVDARSIAACSAS